MSVTGNKSLDRATFRIFWQTYLLQRKLALLALLHPLGAIAFGTLVPLIIGKILASLLLPDSDPLGYLPWLVSVAFVGATLNRFGFRQLMKIQALGAAHLQRRTLDTLLRRSVGFHNNNVSGKLVSDAIDFPNSYQQVVGVVYINLFPFALTVTVGTAIVFAHSWPLGVIILLMSILTLGAGIWDRYRRNDMRMEQLKATKTHTARLADTIVNVQTVKTFAAEQKEFDEGRRLGNILRDLRLRNWIAAGTSGNNRIFALLAMQIVLVIAIVKLVQRDPHVLAAGIFAFSFTTMLATRLFDVNMLLRNLDDALLHAQPMTEILLQDIEVKDKSNAVNSR